MRGAERDERGLEHAGEHLDGGELRGDPSLLPGGNMYPDLVNRETRAIYEIKPLGWAAQGAQDLENYIQAAAIAGVVLTPGAGGPGTSGTIVYPSGFTVDYGLAAPGLIVYQTGYTPLWVPVPNTQNQRSPFPQLGPVRMDVATGAVVVVGAGLALYYVPIVAIPAFVLSF